VAQDPPELTKPKYTHLSMERKGGFSNKIVFLWVISGSLWRSAANWEERLHQPDHLL